MDWSEEQRLRFNNCCTYHKKVPSSPPSDLGDLLVVDCATDPVPTEPITSPPPFPANRFHPDRTGSAHPGIPARGPLHPAVFPYGFPSWRKRGARVHALLHHRRTGHPWPPASARLRQMTNTCHCSPAVSRTSGTGATLCLRLTHYSHTSHSTALSAAHHSPIAAPGAAQVPLHSTHGPSRAAPATATWIRSDPATATVAHTHPARDSVAIPLHGSQITAATQPCGAFNITATTATVLIAVTFPIDPATAAAAAAIDTVTTVAVATTRATPSHTEPRRPSCGHAEPHQHGSTHVTSRRHSPGWASHTSGHSLCSHHSHSSSRSKDGHHLSSSRVSPSRRSRSRSHLRSSSPTADHDDYPSYPEKVAQVRLLFADSLTMLAHPPNPAPVRDVNLASCQSTTPPRPHDLPWNPSTAQIWDHYMDQLTGRDPKAKSSTGLGPATFLRHPKFRERVYRVSSHPKAACAAQVPSKFRVLPPPKKATAHSRPLSRTSTCPTWRYSCAAPISSCPTRTGS